MSSEDNKKIKEFLQKDKIVSDKANAVFDNFISEIRKNSTVQTEKEDIKVQKVKEIKEEKVVNFEEAKERLGIYKFRRFLAVAASLMIVFVGSNAYAHTRGYDNIFFMIKELTTSKTVENPDEIFSDRDIVISYTYFQLTNGTEMQINEMQVKDNEAKLYLLVRENIENEDAPFKYKVFDDKDTILYEGKSTKELDKKVYTEVLRLSNYRDDVNTLKLEVYNRSNELLKTVSIDLEEKTIEAKTENVAVQKISQIELNKFLAKETEKCFTAKELKDSSIIILDTYDIFYSDEKYVVKYLFMKPESKQFDENKVEDADIYLNTVEIKAKGESFELISIDKPELFK